MYNTKKFIPRVRLELHLVSLLVMVVLVLVVLHALCLLFADVFSCLSLIFLYQILYEII